MVNPLVGAQPEPESAAEEAGYFTHEELATPAFARVAGWRYR